MPNEPIVPPVPPKAPEVPPVVVPPVVPPVVTPPAEPTVYDAAVTAVEAWQANPTPELKTAAQEAVKKAKEFQPTAKVAPEKYDLKLPEGSKLDAKHLESVTAFAKANKLSQDEAKALVERDDAVSKAQYAKLDAEAKQFIESLVPLAKADKDIGGESFDKNVQLAQRVVTKFDTNGVFKKMLDETGYGNHPEVIRIFRNIGNAMKEDELVIAPPAPSEKKSTAQVLFG